MHMIRVILVFKQAEQKKENKEGKKKGEKKKKQKKTLFIRINFEERLPY